MTRIRYKYNGATGRFESPPIMCGHGYVTASYHNISLDYKIETVDGALIEKGVDRTLPLVKKVMKARLSALGAYFGEEVRVKKVT